MEGCVEHGISFQPSVNRPPFGLSRILGEELVSFCCEQVHVERFPIRVRFYRSNMPYGVCSAQWR